MWTRDWPTKVGYYWFYGWAFMLKGRREGKPELLFVKVRKTANPNIVVCIGSGNFIYESESDGMWQEAQLPELPIDI